MNTKWNFSFGKMIILYACGILLGGEIALLVTGNVSSTAAPWEITSMLLVSLTVVMGCRIKR